MRGVDDLHIVLLVEVPDLGHDGFGGVDQPLDLFLEGADHHGVGQPVCQFLVGFELLADVLTLVCSQQP